MGCAASKGGTGDCVQSPEPTPEGKARTAKVAPQAPGYIEHDSPTKILVEASRRHRLEGGSAHEEEQGAKDSSSGSEGLCCTLIPSADRSSVDSAGADEPAPAGRPWDFHNKGVPLPPCNDQRVATLRATTHVEGPPDPQIDHIVSLICTIFKTEAALVALVDDNRIFIKNAQGFMKGDFPWRWSFCAWTLAPTHHQIMCIEDTHEDARFSENQFVLGEPHVRFYCGTPLVASNGHRLGTLCFVDTKPRRMDAESCMILNNLSEMVVRELEKDVYLSQQRHQAQQLHQLNVGLLRAMDSFKEAVMVVDTSGRDGWTVEHINSSVTSETGLQREAIVQKPLWDNFELPLGTLPSRLFEESLQSSQEFTVCNCRSRANGNRYNLVFRPASKDCLDENTIPIGVPSYLPASGSRNAWWFVSVQPFVPSQFSSPRRTGQLQPKVVPFDGLQLGPLLGKGSFGKVYRGKLGGKTLAVKIVESSSKAAKDSFGTPMEAVVTQGVDHPNVVSLVDFKMLEPDPSAKKEIVWDSANQGEERGGKGELWFLLEFCDKGCLQDAVDRGWFRETCSIVTGIPNVHSILETIRDIAAGMAHMHDRGVVHGDMTGGNIMLQGCVPVAPSTRNFVAKVSDFGLAREMELVNRIETATYGTVTHMPPELLVEGLLTKAADVFALGILIWEMFCGQRSWAGLRHPQIIHAIAVARTRPAWPVTAPKALVELSQACWHDDLKSRPTFEAVVITVDELLQRDWHQPAADKLEGVHT
eukprot:jgi/Astpho2/4428/Aster-00044